LGEAIRHLRAGRAPQVERQDYLRALARNLLTLAETDVRLKDHAAAVEAADALAESKPELPLHHYYAACFIARSIPFVREDPKFRDETARRAKENEYKARAVAHLRTAITRSVKGFKRIPEEAKYFAVLTGTPDFAEAMRDLDAKIDKP